MELYRVMLVDDEEEVIQAIIRRVNWEELGFQVVGYAKNGQDALEMLEVISPDVIMTDIKMPFMDGLELCKNVREIYGNIRMIIFSGFDEFEYAREAIKLEAEEYILKPINAKEMIEVFFRLKESLDKEREEKRDLQKLTEYYFQSLPIMQEQYLSSLVEGKVPEDKIDYFLETYQMQLKSNYYASMAINIEGKRESKLLEQGEALLEEQLRVVSVKQYLDEKLSEKWNFKSFLYLGKVNYILLLEKQTDINSFINSMDRLCKMTEKVLGISILSGIGQVCYQRRLLPDSYKNATLILSYRGVQDESRSIYINELDPHFCSTPVIGMHSVQDIVAEIKVGNKQQLQEAISNFCVKLRNVKIGRAHV